MRKGYSEHVDVLIPYYARNRWRSSPGSRHLYSPSTSGDDNFRGLSSVDCEVIGPGPLLYMFQFLSCTIHIAPRDYQVCVICIFVDFIDDIPSREIGSCHVKKGGARARPLKDASADFSEARNLTCKFSTMRVFA